MTILLRLYKLYGMAWILGLVVLALWIYVNATASGIRTGTYAVTFYTNTHGENYLELVGLFLAIPAILLIVYDFLKALTKPRAKP